MLAYKGADAKANLQTQRAMKLLRFCFCRTEDVFIGDEAKTIRYL
ncbi:MAG: hypothetical protein ACLTDB_09570 [[Ruminococcus] torques]